MLTVWSKDRLLFLWLRIKSEIGAGACRQATSNSRRTLPVRRQCWRSRRWHIGSCTCVRVPIHEAQLLVNVCWQTLLRQRRQRQAARGTVVPPLLEAPSSFLQQHCWMRLCARTRRCWPLPHATVSQSNVERIDRRPNDHARGGGACIRAFEFVESRVAVHTARRIKIQCKKIATIGRRTDASG